MPLVTAHLVLGAYLDFASLSLDTAKSCALDVASIFAAPALFWLMSLIRMANTPPATASRLAACKATARRVRLRGLRDMGCPPASLGSQVVSRRSAVGPVAGL